MLNDFNASELQYRYVIEWVFAIDYLFAAQIGAAVSGGLIGQMIESKDLMGNWSIETHDPGDRIIFS